jgi:DNA polymerase (family X)
VAPLDKKEAAKVLEKIALMMELKGENTFKVRAYQKGARSLETLEGSLEELIAENELKKVPGIGQALREKIIELVETGELQYYEDLKREFPETLFDLFRVQGLGPKKVKVLYEELEIETLGELEYACLENRLAELKGFGKKTQEKILLGIENLKKYRGKYLVSIGISVLEELREYFSGNEKILRFSEAGSLRRRKEVIKDVDILAAVKETDRKDAAEFFAAFEKVEEIIAKGETKISVRLKSGINVDLRLVTEEEFPFALHHFTGSKDHNTKMRQIAKEKGLKMNEYGIFHKDKPISAKTEAEIFNLMGLSMIPPELREDQGEIEAAAENKLPDLVEQKDLKGLFHIHSHYSDGVNAIEEIIQEAADQGFQYIGISDHSQTAYYANGLKPEDVEKQHREIDQLREKYPQIKILKGIESDILNNGDLDYDPEVLEKFDYIIASLHSNLKMDKERMTKRLLGAIQNPHTKILGHMTGRLLLSRDGCDFDEEQVFSALKEHNVAVEINSNPHRLDLDWRKCKVAKSMGIPITIDPDAHIVSGFQDIKYGVGIARKGWIEKEDVINAKDFSDLVTIWDLKQGFDGK